MEWMKQASTSAAKSDAVFFYVFGLSVVFLIFITALMIWFVVRYNKTRHPQAEQIEGHTGLEILWTVVPLVLFMTIFYYGWTNFDYMRQAPRDSMQVLVTARQWSWTFKYPNGKQSDKLFAPLNKPMKLEVRSADVVHGFAVAAFRLKIDAVPSRGNTTWFQATQPGIYDIQCTVICGVKHSEMLSHVVVVPEEEFKAWYFGDERAPEPGKNLKTAAQAGHASVPGYSRLQDKGCLACHSTDGRPMVGPTFKGLFGKEEVVLVAGAPRTVTVDEAYLRDAILRPREAIVQGYPPAMPPVPMAPAELAEVVDYLKTLK
ncbi:MAG: cytochrome c oxidase subunit II [Acidobacteria bacterium]|nr:cytochrome c oxidase subunit II [Acidobacteriota bacterium]